MLKIPYALFMNAVMNNDGRELEVNGYLNRIDGKVRFAFDADFPKEKIPDDGIDYALSRRLIDECPEKWIKIPKVPKNYSLDPSAFISRFFADNGIKARLVEM
jgi:hypothetical protein